LAPALGFCFDREGRTETERKELITKSNGLIRFIPRRMYENYLLNAKAIAHILNRADLECMKPVAEQEVEEWLISNGPSEANMRPSKGSDWKRDSNAARLLRDLFNALSDARVCFEKTRHGIQLTEWIVENSPEDLHELSNFLEDIISEKTSS